MQLFDRLNQIMLSYCFKQWNQVTFPLTIFCSCKVFFFFQSLKAKCQFGDFFFIIFCVSFLNVIIWIFSIFNIFFDPEDTFRLCFTRDILASQGAILPLYKRERLSWSQRLSQLWLFASTPPPLPSPTLWLSIQRLNCPTSIMCYDVSKRQDAFHTKDW